MQEFLKYLGRLDCEVIRFLGQCSHKIEHCELDFEDLADFMGELAHAGIKLDEFLDALGR